MPNDHYLTESLIKPWCHTKWDCSYYDDSTNKIERDKPISSTFALKNMNKPKVETALNKYLETPLCNFRDQLFLENGSYLKILNDFNFQNVHKKVKRSIYIWFHLQCFRYEKNIHFIKGEDDLTLDDFMKSIEENGEKFLNLFAQHVANQKMIVLLKIPQPYMLFLPDTGYFPFPFPDKGHVDVYKFGIILPFTPEYGFALCDKTMDIERFINNHEEINLISYFSTYNHNYEKIIKFIIPPQIIKNGFSDEEIIKSVQDMRAQASILFNARKKILECITEAYKIVGLNPCL